MKDIKQYISEGITVIDKPDKNKVSQIDLTKVGKAIKDASGDNTVLIYSIKKGYNYESFKINTNGELYQSTYDKNDKWVWKKTKNLNALFSKISMRDSSTINAGIVKKDIDDPLDTLEKGIVDEELSNKLAEYLGINSLRMGTNSWRSVFRGLYNKCK